jgi:hypothetical protein
VIAGPLDGVVILSEFFEAKMTINQDGCNVMEFKLRAKWGYISAIEDPG